MKTTFWESEEKRRDLCHFGGHGESKKGRRIRFWRFQDEASGFAKETRSSQVYT